MSVAVLPGLKKSILGCLTKVPLVYLIGWVEMRNRSSWGRLSLGLSAIFVWLGIAYPGSAQPVQSVEVTPVEVVDVSPRHEFVGRVEAVNSVDLLARVQGFVEQRLFQEGQVVQKDQPLFAIEKQSYELALRDAQAARDIAQVNLDDAERRLRRNQSLSRNTVSQAVLEESEAARDAARARLQSAEVNVGQAELNLSYTTVRSPFDGRVGASNISIGSLAGGGSTVLARVVETDPIRVVFSVTDRTILTLREAAGGLSKEELSKEFQIALRLSNDQNYAHLGEIEFFDNQVDVQTGTVAVRATFPNPDTLLVPNQFVTVVVGEVEPLMKPVVPLSAVQQDREGRFVLVADDQDRAALRRIEATEQFSGAWIVEGGLAGGERLITGNLQGIAEGSQLSIVPAGDGDGGDGDGGTSP